MIRMSLEAWGCGRGCAGTGEVAGQGRTTVQGQRSYNVIVT